MINQGPSPRLHRPAVFIALLALLATACSSASPEAATPSLVVEPEGTTSSSSTTVPTDAAGETTTAPANSAVPAPGETIGFDQWSSFRGDPQRRAFDGGPEGDDAPDLAWQAATGGIVESSPAVVNGLVISGTFDNAVVAFDAASGDEVWRFSVGGLVRSSPAVVDGVAYFGADDNLFYAIDSVTGTEIWRFELGGGGQQSSPSVVDDEG